MSLLVVDTLNVATDIGDCCIDLCLGDVTKLPREQAVDVLVVSAFAGDYTPTSTSLIGALQNQLGISVRGLSKDKEEDLRKQFFCWWSKPLPEKYSFRRILCFEGAFGHGRNTPPQTVGAVFRCLVSVLNNKEGTVMMPLLASGDQGYSKQLMLRLLVESAVKWMKTGLPLRTLKIVVYSPRPDKNVFAKDPVFRSFQELKERHGEKEVESKDIKDKFDIYLSHSSEDHNLALEVVKSFKSHSKNLRVFCEVQKLDVEQSWQKEMFEVISSCTRVIVLLSPSFIETDYCIEQYNIALCIGRRLHREFLAPFFIVSVSFLPTYMGLVQYIDCRTKNVNKIKDATITIAEWCQSNTIESVSQTTLSTASSASESNAYDVFISYSHVNKTAATKILECLQGLDSSLKIFIDSAELTAGTSWQQTLYHAIESSRGFVALLSAPYLNSKVCREEFSLALALDLDTRSELHLTSLMIEELGNLPVWCSEPLPVDCVCTKGLDEARIKTVCENLVQKLHGETVATDYLQGKLEALKGKNLSLEELSEMFRKVCFAAGRGLLKQSCVLNSPDGQQRVGHSTDDSVEITCVEAEEENHQTNSCILALSYASADVIFAAALKKFLSENDPSINIADAQDNASARLSLLDEASLIVPLLSPAYLSSKHLVDELNIALCRQRSSSTQVIFPVHVEALPYQPAYVHLITCRYSVLDKLWSLQHQKVCPELKRLADDLSLSYNVTVCLKSMADTIVEQLKDLGQNSFGRVLLSPAEVTRDWEELNKKLENENFGKDDLIALQSLGLRPQSVDGHADEASHKSETVEKDAATDERKAEEHSDETNNADVSVQPLSEEEPLTETNEAQDASSLNESVVQNANNMDGAIAVVSRKNRSKTCHIC